MFSSALIAALLSAPLLVSAHPGHGHNLNARAVDPNGSCGGSGGFTCAGAAPCCSQWGYCGSGDQYCGAGCQAGFGTCSGGGGGGGGGGTTTAAPPPPPATSSTSPPPASGPVSPNGSCGGSAGYRCPGSDPCCSQYGWCGSTDAYCGAGCQSGFGTCAGGGGGGGTTTTAPPPPASTTTTAAPPPPASSSSTPPPSGPVSPNGSCGGSAGYRCPGSDPCCSQYGWCGTTDAYCGAGCQAAFGTCAGGGTGGGGTTTTTSATPPPVGTGTAGIPRPKVGNVPYGSVITECVHAGDLALTFDDGPYIYTPDLLTLLARYGVKASFFIVGSNGNGDIDKVAAWTSIIQREYNEGHQVCSHTWDHADLTTLSSAQRRDEMYKNEAAFVNILGFFPTYMRPPYLSFDSACAADMADLGYHVISTNLDTLDWANDDPNLIQNSKNTFNAAVSNNSPNNANYIVLNHDIHYQTVYSLVEYEIQRVQATGYRFVTIGECLGDPPANWYRSGAAAKRAVPVPHLPAAAPVSSADLAKLGFAKPTKVCTYVEAPSGIENIIKKMRLARGMMSEAVYY